MSTVRRYLQKGLTGAAAWSLAGPHMTERPTAVVPVRLARHGSVNILNGCDSHGSLVKYLPLVRRFCFEWKYFWVVFDSTQLVVGEDGFAGNADLMTLASEYWEKIRKHWQVAKKCVCNLAYTKYVLIIEGGGGKQAEPESR